MAEASQTGRTVARRAGLVTAGTFGSRVLGMVRDIAIAASFPLAATDAFFIAFTIPSTLRVLLGEGAVQNAFVPVFAKVRARDGIKGARRFLARFSGSLLFLLALTVAIGIWAAPWLANLYAAGYRGEPAQLARVTSLTRWLFPFLLTIGVAALGAGALNSVGRFGVAAVSPALMNVGMIAAALGLANHMAGWGLEPITALAWGALAGTAMHALANAAALRREGLLSRPRWGFSDPDVQTAMALMLPLLAGMGIHQVNLVLSRMFASYLPEGSQSYLSYGVRIVEIPQGMFAVAVASATLPTLARMRSEDRHEEMRDLLRYTLRMSAFVAVPASVALFCLAEPTVATLFGRGAFGPEQISQTGYSLGYQALGICSVAGVRAVIPMFSAHHDTRAPVVCSGLSLLTFIVSASLLMGPMAHAGLALATTLAATAQLVALLLWLPRRAGPLGLRAVGVSLARTLAAAVVMGFVITGLAQWLGIASEPSEASRLARYAATVAVGGLTYLAAAALLRSPELGELVATVRRRGARAAKNGEP